MYLPKPILKKHLLRLLEADLGMGDVTSYALIPAEKEAVAEVVVKEQEPVILAGIEEVTLLFEELGLFVEAFYKDGEQVTKGEKILRIKGKARDILVAERTALNLLMRMSGIATVTRRMQEKINQVGAKCKIAATRKTIPGLIYFDKKAVAIGGGDTHRLHLEDMVLIKDNHIALAGGIERAIKLAKEKVSFSKKIEIEVQTKEEALKAASLGADIVMLDNFSPEEVKETIALLKEKGLRKRVLIEISGNINPDNILAYAKANPDIISCGLLTHSVKAVDMSMRVHYL
jgi:nicotinate-nucleotide pyrophosphorylase (carboxylating)